MDHQSISQRVPIGGVEHLATGLQHDVLLISQIESNILAEVLDLRPLGQLDELAPVLAAERGHGRHVVVDHDLLLEDAPASPVHRPSIFVLADLIRSIRQISWRFFLGVGAAHI